jgi:hypothetical protein
MAENVTALLQESSLPHLCQHVNKQKTMFFVFEMFTMEHFSVRFYCSIPLSAVYLTNAECNTAELRRDFSSRFITGIELLTNVAE